MNSETKDLFNGFRTLMHPSSISEIDNPTKRKRLRQIAKSMNEKLNEKLSGRIEKINGQTNK